MGSARKKRVILTYNGLDGACAAATALLKYPDADVRPTSAGGIGELLQALEEEKPAEVHVCGVGVWCDWEEVAAPAERLRHKHKTAVHWYCGRGYLDDEAEQFSRIATTHFLDAGTNTAAVAEALSLTDQFAAHMLTRLAACDHNVEGARGEKDVEPEERAWMDLIEATLAQYFKYQNRDPYIAAIQHLAAGNLTKSDRALIDQYRRTGNRYVLHGRSPVMKRLQKRIGQCAAVNRHILITGESGVGKEHAAQLICEGSDRAMGPLIVVNCALYAGNASLANSDLFGHLRGAFTGAIRDRKGKFVEADNGILYLDEIGDLTLEVQAKLLRVLEDGQVTPEGADEPTRRVNVRIIAATNKPLPDLIRKGEFRADLYHRIATLRVHVPPLRERMADLETLVQLRLDTLRAEGFERRFSKGDYQALRDYSWPGNVRQLLKVVDRAVLLSMSAREVIEEEKSLGELVAYAGNGDDTGDGGIPLPQCPADVRPMKAVLHTYARHAWLAHDRNTTQAAAALDLSANTLRKYLDEAKA